MFSFYPELTGNPPRYALGARRSPNTSDLSTRKHWWVLFTLSKSLFDHSRRLHINLSSNQAAEGLKWKCHQACFQLNALPKRPVHPRILAFGIKGFHQQASGPLVQSGHKAFWAWRCGTTIPNQTGAAVVGGHESGLQWWWWCLNDNHTLVNYENKYFGSWSDPSITTINVLIIIINTSYYYFLLLFFNLPGRLLGWWRLLLHHCDYDDDPFFLL